MINLWRSVLEYLLSWLGLLKKSRTLERMSAAGGRGTDRKILVLDLDETLVYSTTHWVLNYDFTTAVLFDGTPALFYVMKRPHLEVFMRKVSQWYDIVIFTSSLRSYAEPVIDRLEFSSRVKKRYFRQNCVLCNGQWVKDLSVLHSELSSIVLIDNSPAAYSVNKENGLPIDSWTGDNPRDESLLNMIPFLQALRFTKDVRSVLSLRLHRPSIS